MLTGAGSTLQRLQWPWVSHQAILCGTLCSAMRDELVIQLMLLHAIHTGCPVLPGNILW